MFWCAGQVAHHARKQKDPGKVTERGAADQSSALQKAVGELQRLRIGGNQGVGRGRMALTLRSALPVEGGAK